MIFLVALSAGLSGFGLGILFDQWYVEWHVSRKRRQREMANSQTSHERSESAESGG
jgi:hypothetical protein